MRELTTIGVVGLGQMGGGIAEVMARAGFTVTGVEADAAALERGQAGIERSTGKALARGKISESDRDALLERITYTTDRSQLASLDLVIEAVPEVLAIKQELFAALNEICSAETILATNTSSLSVTQIAEVVTTRPERVIGVHFFNPVPVLRFIEIITTSATDAEVTATIENLADTLGYARARVSDQAGFIANALLFDYLLGAMTEYEVAQVGVAAIDTAVTDQLNYPMGPFTLMDLIGLDTCVQILQRMVDAGRPGYEVPAVLRSLVEAGSLGRKSGAGFYRYTEDGPQVALVRDAEQDVAAELVAGRILDRFVRAAEAMVASGYTIEADVDLTMRKGMGMPAGPFAMKTSHARLLELADVTSEEPERESRA